MEFDSELAAEYTEWTKTVPIPIAANNKPVFNSEIAALVQAACQEAVDKALQNIPYSKQAPPKPERFHNNTDAAKKYAAYIPDCLLTEITGTKIDTMLGAIRTVGKLKEQTMKNMRYVFIQPLHFAYRNNLLA